MGQEKCKLWFALEQVNHRIQGLSGRVLAKRVLWRCGVVCMAMPERLEGWNCKSIRFVSWERVLSTRFNLRRTASSF
jgi:hypothetical protein